MFGEAEERENDMDRDEFIRHWVYFCSIAKRLEETAEYVYHGLNEEEVLEHGTVYSDVFKQILLLSGAEFENMSKALCVISGYSLKRDCNIRDISYCILDKYPQIVETQIYSLYWFKKPLNEWCINVKENEEVQVEGIEWWKAYTDVKHNKENSYKLCSLDNALSALSALYVIDLYVMKLASGNLDTANNFPPPYFRCEYTADYFVTKEKNLPGL